jgi:hypothetical protein
MTVIDILILSIVGNLRVEVVKTTKTGMQKSTESKFMYIVQLSVAFSSVVIRIYSRFFASYLSHHRVKTSALILVARSRTAGDLV